MTAIRHRDKRKAMRLLLFFLAVGLVRAQAPVSDDFSSGSLNTALWTIVNPVGDGTVSFSSARLQLGLPAGVDHDLWTGGNKSIRIMQNVSVGDFEVEAKFETIPTTQYQTQGIIAE